MFIFKENNFIQFLIVLTLYQSSLIAQTVSETSYLIAPFDNSLMKVETEENINSYELDLKSLEETLAKKFAPILHKDPSDKQLELADINNVVQYRSHLKYRNFSITDNWTWGDRGTLHYFKKESDLTYYCSSGVNPTILPPISWILDIDDKQRYNGADVGSRPLYYHCYKYEEYYYLQYWYFFTMNDLSNQTLQGVWHEGDWEHISLKIENQNGNYVPVEINIYQHEGGYKVKPSQAWWGNTSGKYNYQTMQKGYDEDHTRLHIWIARNSQASYNRWDDQYVVNVTIAGQHIDRYNEDVKYATLQSLFEYDILINMGEIQRSPRHPDYPDYDTAHDSLIWNPHYIHKPAQNSPKIDAIAFVGRIGEYWQHWTGKSTISPLSPTMGEGHEWLKFSESNRWGHSNQSWLFWDAGKITWAEYNIANNLDIFFAIPFWHDLSYSYIYTAGFEASNTITVSDIIGGDGVNGANVIFADGKSIHLKPGFHAQKGSTFHAYIDENLKE